MTNDEITARVLELICDHLGAEPVDVVPRARFAEDLGADSLDLVELLSAFEEEFEASIPDEDSSWLETVGDAVECVRRALTPLFPVQPVADAATHS